MTGVFGRLLGSMSRYRLVTLSLAFLVAWSFGLVALGQLFLDPVAMVLTLATLVLVSYASNRAFAALLRVTPHSESAIITALILFFVVFPTSDAFGLLVLAVVAWLANASKYIIVARGRHVLNPAAFGIAAMTLTGLTSASWWVGTSGMLAPVVIFAAIILWRMGQLLTGAAFVVLTAGLYAFNMLQLGATDSFAGGLLIAVTAYPIVYLAGFMLSEPASLADRRWQQLVVVLVVALISAFPFAIGSVLISPDFAIVAGNLVAFALSRGSAPALRFIESRALTPTVRELRFRTARPNMFVPGQYIELTLPGRSDWRGRRRAFSVTSAPGERELSVAVKFPARPSRFKRALAELEPDVRVQATRFSGDFVLPRDPRAPLLLVAGGIGVTPFVSQLAAMRQRGEERDVILIWALSSTREIAYSTLEPARVIAFVPDSAVLPTSWEYGGAARLSIADIRRLVPDVPERHVFVSGSPEFVVAASAALRHSGARHIRYDEFFGY